MSKMMGYCALKRTQEIRWDIPAWWGLGFRVQGLGPRVQKSSDTLVSPSQGVGKFRGLR